MPLEPYHRTRLVYGARFSGTTANGREFVAFMNEEDFKLALKMAFAKHQDLDKALDAVRMLVVKKVASRV